MSKWIDTKSLSTVAGIKLRNKAIAKKFKTGIAMEDIGLVYAISRERVRQILAAMNVETSSGGARLRGRNRRAAIITSRISARDSRVRMRYGCSAKEYDVIMKGTAFKINRNCKAYVYYHNKINWCRNEQGPVMSFKEWDRMWTRSGKYELRGTHKHNYVMSRKGNTGPWIIKNVHIVKAGYNISNMPTEIKLGHDVEHCKYGHVLKNNQYHFASGNYCKTCLIERERSKRARKSQGKAK